MSMPLMTLQSKLAYFVAGWNLSWRAEPHYSVRSLFTSSCIVIPAFWNASVIAKRAVVTHNIKEEVFNHLTF
jgi:hypothetical protein